MIKKMGDEDLGTMPGKASSDDAGAGESGSTVSPTYDRFPPSSPTLAL